MKLPITVTQKQLFDVLLHVAIVRPVHIWGQPGIGKTDIVGQFAQQLGMPYVPFLLSQLAPEDLVGVPQIVNGFSRFCPPEVFHQEVPFVLFLDELNGASLEIRRAAYSLILDRRIGTFNLPEGTIVIAAGNRAQDNAIVQPMPSALINRMTHVELTVSHRDWLDWAYAHDIHTWVTDYIQAVPTHLVSPPQPFEEPFSSPRSWHYVSDELKEYGENISSEELGVLLYGNLTPQHAANFRGFVQKIRGKYDLARIFKGDASWPRELKDREVLYFLAHSFRAQLVRELPPEQTDAEGTKHLAYRAKAMMRDLAAISFEMAQLVVTKTEEGAELPGWFMVELVRELPKLAVKTDANGA